MHLVGSIGLNCKGASQVHNPASGGVKAKFSPLQNPFVHWPSSKQTPGSQLVGTKGFLT